MKISVSIIFLLIPTLSFAGAFNAVSAIDLMDYFKFEEGTGTSVYSYVPGTATFTAATEATGQAWVTGKVGLAMSLDGNGAWTLPRRGLHWAIEDFTIMAWIYPTTLTGGRRRVYNQSNTGGTNRWGMAVNNGNVEIITDVDCLPCTSVGTYAINTWTHIAVVRDSGVQCRIYIDGEFDSSFSCTDTTSFQISNDIGLGYYTLGGERFQGYLDEVLAFRRLLSVGEINNHRLTTLGSHPQGAEDQ